MSVTPLEESLLKTVAWFAGFSYPVSAFELWKWAYRPPSETTLGEVVRVLDTSSVLTERLQCKDGFFAPKEMDLATWIQLRRARALDADRKYQKLRRAARFMAWVPSVRCVAAANTLAFWSTRKESDIDLFVLTAPKTVWTTRFALVAPAALLRTRPGEGEDPFCFSFFASESATDLSSLRLSDGDPYFAYWVASLVPVVFDVSAWRAFHAANAWVREELPHAFPRVPHPRLAVRRRSFLFPRGMFESLLRAFQKKRLPRALSERANQGTDIVITDEILKFHDMDRRAEYRDAWQARCNRLLA